MNVEARARYLLRAALRAEGEGNSRAAGLLRRMADEMRPLEPVRVVPVIHPARGCCHE